MAHRHSQAPHEPHQFVPVLLHLLRQAAQVGGPVVVGVGVGHAARERGSAERSGQMIVQVDAERFRHELGRHRVSSENVRRVVVRRTTGRGTVGRGWCAETADLCGFIVPPAAGRRLPEYEPPVCQPSTPVAVWGAPTGLDSGDPRWRR